MDGANMSCEVTSEKERPMVEPEWEHHSAVDQSFLGKEIVVRWALFCILRNAKTNDLDLFILYNQRVQINDDKKLRDSRDQALFTAIVGVNEGREDA